MCGSGTPYVMGTKMAISKILVLVGKFLFLSHQKTFSFFFYNNWRDVSGYDIANVQNLTGLYYISLCIDTVFLYLYVFVGNGVLIAKIQSPFICLSILHYVNHLFGCTFEVVLSSLPSIKSHLTSV